MTSSVRLADRLLTALTGLVLLVGALWLIGDRALVPIARQASDRIDPHAIARAPQWPWWSAALACVGFALLLFGLWVVLAHVRPTASRLGAAARGPIALDRIAAAAAADVARHPQVHSARAVIRVEGRAPVIRIVAELPPHTSPADIARLARRCRADAHAAAGPDVDVQFVVKYIGPDHTDTALL
ncbi:conserved hypothetical protein [Segniliparus rotundus DSM 44985]|uniref:Alkaline shock response membrane anchor protein AmaP n=1 Tax=Segniliparus rotundus (strain ATCC BAA-972 / CDC 1076 / CIP 108378 / DSM 44985 / JCM 13578) TaxID=640132 RepID=D6ZDN6_SEGRD|nr:hypothetical protein [Segniliparus rotundus]ADG99293.1 conserved hypothetical protein [Segniliparus rotundus DSM 44985]